MIGNCLSTRCSCDQPVHESPSLITHGTHILPDFTLDLHFCNRDRLLIGTSLPRRVIVPHVTSESFCVAVVGFRLSIWAHCSLERCATCSGRTWLGRVIWSCLIPVRIQADDLQAVAEILASKDCMKFELGRMQNRKLRLSILFSGFIPRFHAGAVAGSGIVAVSSEE